MISKVFSNLNDSMILIPAVFLMVFDLKSSSYAFPFCIVKERVIALTPSLAMTRPSHRFPTEKIPLILPGYL